MSIRILRGQHPRPATVNLLQERMLDRMSNASRLVEKLRRKGYVQRHVCDNDRRRCDIRITETGLQVLAEIDNGETGWEANFRALSESEARERNALLDKLRQKSDFERR
jgi:DNA-binding MarR family transcriptional regulator